jgi:hypothetical protein
MHLDFAALFGTNDGFPQRPAVRCAGLGILNQLYSLGDRAGTRPSTFYTRLVNRRRY